MDGTADGVRAYALDLSVYRQLGFYQLLDPDGPRLLGVHVYSTVLRAFLAVVQSIVVYGAVGFVADVDPWPGKSSSTFETLVILSNCTLSSLKMYTLVSNADAIWQLFDLARIDFLWCTRARGDHVGADLRRRCKFSVAVANWIARCFLAGLVLWVISPFVTDQQIKGISISKRYNDVRTVVMALCSYTL